MGDEPTRNSGKTTEPFGASDLIADVEEMGRRVAAEGIQIVVNGQEIDVSQVMKIMGSIGGSRKNARKGFGSASPEKRREAALKGLAKRWGKSFEA